MNLILYQLRRADCASDDAFVTEGNEAVRQQLVAQLQAMGISEDLSQLPGYWEAQGYEVQTRGAFGYALADVYRVRDQTLLEVVYDDELLTIYCNHPDLPPMQTAGPPPWFEDPYAASPAQYIGAVRSVTRIPRNVSNLQNNALEGFQDLPEPVREPVFSLVMAGKYDLLRRRYEDAADKFREAFGLLPAPFTDWAVATGVLALVGEAYFSLGEYQQAYAALAKAMQTPGAANTPFLHLRLGQTQFELGNFDRASVELLRAYEKMGEEGFADEKPKYLAFLKNQDGIR